MATKNFKSIEQMFAEMYENSAYTIIGCGGDLAEWKTGYNELLHGAGILPENVNLPEDAWYPTFYGKDMNATFGLTGNNAYQDDLVFLAFDWHALPELVNNMNMLAMFKLRCEDRWFDDVVDNDLRKEYGNVKNAADFLPCIVEEEN